jgi:hypothetical protein
MRLRLHIRSLAGSWLDKGIVDSSSVDNLRAELAAEAGVAPAERVVLMFGGAQLRDGRTLREYSVQDNATLTMIVKPDAPPPAIPLAPALPPPPPTPRLRPTGQQTRAAAATGSSSSGSGSGSDASGLSAEAVVRAYAGSFLAHALAMLIDDDDGGGGGAGVWPQPSVLERHVLFRNLALYLSPPVAAVSSLEELQAAHTDAPEPGGEEEEDDDDGGGGGGESGSGGEPFLLADFRESLGGGAMVAAEFDKLGLDGARLADAILSEAFKPLDAASRDGKDQSRDQSMRARLDRIFEAVLSAAPISSFQRQRAPQHNPPPARAAGLPDV